MQVPQLDLSDYKPADELVSAKNHTPVLASPLINYIIL